MPIWLPIAICLLTLVIHGPLILKTEILVRDDRWLTAPLQNVHSLGDWWALIRSGNLPDFQPMRDLSYWLDWQVAGAMGTGPYFHLTNILIWWAILFLVWKIVLGIFSGPEFRGLPVGVAPAAILVLLMAIHPVAVEPVAWVSGRKHLLSLLFTLIATRLTLLGPVTMPRAALIVAAFAAGTLSQPINVLWPLWAVVFMITNETAAKAPIHRATMTFFAACLILITLAATAINMTVYQGVTWFDFQLTPHAEIYGKKLGGFRWDEIDLSLLAVGRYFFNLLLPFKIAHRYSPGSWANLAGLLMIPLACWAGWRLDKGRRTFWLWSLYAALPVVVVTAQLSDIFVADSYAFAALPGFLIASGVLIAQKTFKKLPVRWFVAAVMGMALAQSILLSRSWLSAESLWQRSQAVEETPDSLYFTAGYLLNSGQHDESLARAKRLLVLSPGSGKTIRLYAFAVCDHPQMNRGEKLVQLDQLGAPDAPPVLDCRATLHHQAGEYVDAATLLIRLAREQPGYFRLEMANGRSRLENACKHVKELKTACAKALEAMPP